jgi:hypothetical protein
MANGGNTLIPSLSDTTKGRERNLEVWGQAVDCKLKILKKTNHHNSQDEVEVCLNCQRDRCIYDKPKKPQNSILVRPRHAVKSVVGVINGRAP